MKRLCLFFSLFMLFLALRDGRVFHIPGYPIIKYSFIEQEGKPVPVISFLLQDADGKEQEITLYFEQVLATWTVPDSRVM